MEEKKKIFKAPKLSSYQKYMVHGGPIGCAALALSAF